MTPAIERLMLRRRAMANAADGYRAVAAECDQQLERLDEQIALLKIPDELTDQECDRILAATKSTRKRHKR